MVIEVKELSVRYKDKQIVRDVSFSVQKGEIFGMIGANGAGKTTIIECIEGLRSQYQGSIEVLGLNPKRNRIDLYKKIGVQLQETSYQDKTRVSELGKLFKSFYKNPANFDTLLKEFDLFEKKDAYIAKLSGGQRQKLSIILALMPNPEIIFLDEITTGLDPKSRKDIWEKIKKLKEHGITIFMTTHFMEEAEYLCDRIAIVRKGEIVALDDIKSLIQSANITDKITFLSNTNIDINLLSSWDGVKTCGVHEEAYFIECEADLVWGKLSSYASQNNILISNINVKRPNLEELFLKYTGEILSDTESQISNESEAKMGGEE